MNAARFARHLIEDGVDPKIAQPLAEHLAEEIERTVATKEHVEIVVNSVVTREVQQLRVEMHQELRRFNTEITQRLDAQSRWLVTSTIVLFLAMLGNIVKDFLR
jgi:predicted RecB family endonuclease